MSLLLCKLLLNFNEKSSSLENLSYLCVMKRIIAKSTLREFWEKHVDSEDYLKTWYQTARTANWKSPKDIKKSYASASFLNDNRVVFNIKGNNYRLIVRINFHYQMMWIRFIGTHKEYDRIDANKI